MSQIEEVLDDLIKDLGIDRMDPEKQADILSELYDTLQMRVGARLAEDLTEEQAAKIEEASKKGEAEAQAALQEVVPNYDELVADELEGMRQELKVVIDTTSGNSGKTEEKPAA
jgi:hypothetical protein